MIYDASALCARKKDAEPFFCAADLQHNKCEPQIA